MAAEKESVHILVVEDDPDINRLLCTILEGEGYCARPAFSGSEALLWAEKYDYDLIMLDLMLPGLTGEEFIQRIRRGRTMPILVLSAKAAVEDRVNVLGLGADDFIPKPFDIREVLARVEAQLRRCRRFSTAEPHAVLTWGDLSLDTQAHTAMLSGQELPLTAHEFAILSLLMAAPKQTFSRAQIYEQVWGEEYMGDDNTVNVHVSNLRSKLAQVDPAGEYIKTVWGVGFRMASL